MAIRPNDAADIGGLLVADAIPIDRVGSTIAQKTTPDEIQNFCLEGPTKDANVKTLRVNTGAGSVNPNFAAEVAQPDSAKAGLFIHTGIALPKQTSGYGAIQACGSTYGSATIAIEVQTNSAGNGARLQLLRHRADKSLPLTNDRVGMIQLGAVASNGTNTPAGVIIDGYAESDWTDTSTPGYFTIKTTAVGNVVGNERLRIRSNGQINIPLAGMQLFADNAAALTGGLLPGDLYRTATGQLMIVY